MMILSGDMSRLSHHGRWYRVSLIDRLGSTGKAYIPATILRTEHHPLIKAIIEMLKSKGLPWEIIDKILWMTGEYYSGISGNFSITGLNKVLTSKGPVTDVAPFDGGVFGIRFRIFAEPRDCECPCRNCERGWPCFYESDESLGLIPHEREEGLPPRVFNRI